MEPDQAIIDRWKSIALHPLESKWTIMDVVIGILIAATISWLWTRVLDNIINIEAFEKIVG